MPLHKETPNLPENFPVLDSTPADFLAGKRVCHTNIPQWPYKHLFLLFFRDFNCDSHYLQTMVRLLTLFTKVIQLLKYITLPTKRFCTSQLLTCYLQFTSYTSYTTYKIL